MPIYPAFAGESCEGRFLFNRKVILLNKNAPRRLATLKRACSLSSLHSLSEPMPAAAGNYAAEAPLRRRRIPRAGFYLIKQQ